MKSRTDIEQRQPFHGRFDEQTGGGKNGRGQGFQACHNQNWYNLRFTMKEIEGEYPKAIRLLTRIWSIEKGLILIQTKSLI